MMGVEQACLWRGRRAGFMHEREAANAQGLGGESAWVRQAGRHDERHGKRCCITCRIPAP